MEPDGAITDGDDYLWSGDPLILEEAGGWNDLVNAQSKQHAETAEPEGNTHRHLEKCVCPDLGQDAHTTPTPGADIIDLTMSLPIPSLVIVAASIPSSISAD